VQEPEGGRLLPGPELPRCRRNGRPHRDPCAWAGEATEVPGERDLSDGNLRFGAEAERCHGMERATLPGHERGLGRACDWIRNVMGSFDP
jgi:hypothetical protein